MAASARPTTAVTRAGACSGLSSSAVWKIIAFGTAK
jgi:hypothetical protein